MFGGHLEVVEDLVAEVSGQNVSLQSHLCAVLWRDNVWSPSRSS